MDTENVMPKRSLVDSGNITQGSPKKVIKEVTVSPHNEQLRVKLLSEKAKLPTRGSVGAVGYDLYSAVEIVVPAKGKALISTDISVAIPQGCYGRVAPRSGLAVKNFIDVGAGVIDPDYRGPVGVLLFNHSDKGFHVTVGDRVAQLVLEKVMLPPVVHCTELDVTVRGTGGYGSTGIQ